MEPYYKVLPYLIYGSQNESQTGLEQHDEKYVKNKNKW